MIKEKPKTWPALVALAVIYLAAVMEWNWVWGVLFLMWFAPGLLYRETHLVVSVREKDSPFVFWLIMVSWIVLSLLLIGWDIYRFFGGSQ